MIPFHNFLVRNYYHKCLPADKAGTKFLRRIYRNSIFSFPLACVGSKGTSEAATIPCRPQSERRGAFDKSNPMRRKIFLNIKKLIHKSADHFYPLPFGAQRRHPRRWEQRDLKKKKKR